MGPHKYFLIDNNYEGGFKEKIRKTKEAVFDVLGTKTATEFNKKYLLTKSEKDGFPIYFDKLPVARVMDIYETYIDYKSPFGEVVSCCVEHRL